MLVTPRPWFRHHIEHDQRAAPEIVPALQYFTIRPDEAASGELRRRPKRGLETIRDGEQRAVPIPHRPAPLREEVMMLQTGIVR
ncbi:MAG: hypothetical protein K8R23_19270 [Chthoniobacter sp.]|nr:hypothetical protein [Chthoniobacter sp.]